MEHNPSTYNCILFLYTRPADPQSAELSGYNCVQYK